MKKFISLFVILLLALVLVACNGDEDTPEIDSEFSALWGQIDIPTVVTTDVTQITFLAADAVTGVDGLESITWTTSNLDVISATGAVTHAFVNIPMSVTATATIHGVERSSTRALTVHGTGGDAIFDNIFTDLGLVVPTSAIANFNLPLTTGVAGGESAVISWTSSNPANISFPIVVADDAEVITARVTREYETVLADLTATVVLNGFTRTRTYRVPVARMMDLTGAYFSGLLGTVDGPTGTPIGLPGNLPRPQLVTDQITGELVEFGLWNAGRTSLNVPVGATAPTFIQVATNPGGNGGLAGFSGFQTNFRVDALSRVFMEFSLQNTAASRNNWANAFGIGSDERGSINIYVSPDRENWTAVFDILEWQEAQFTSGGEVTTHSEMMTLEAEFENPYERAYFRVALTAAPGAATQWTNTLFQSLILFSGEVDNTPLYDAASAIAAPFLAETFVPADAIAAIIAATALDQLKIADFTALPAAYQTAMVNRILPILTQDSGVSAFRDTLEDIYEANPEEVENLIGIVNRFVEFLNFVIDAYTQIVVTDGSIAVIEGYDVLTRAMVEELRVEITALVASINADPILDELNAARAAALAPSVNEAALLRLEIAIEAFLIHRAYHRLELAFMLANMTDVGALSARVNAIETTIDEMTDDAFLAQLITYFKAALAAEGATPTSVLDALLLVGGEMVGLSRFPILAAITTPDQMVVINAVITGASGLAALTGSEFVTSLDTIIADNLSAIGIAKQLFAGIMSGTPEDVVENLLILMEFDEADFTNATTFEGLFQDLQIIIAQRIQTALEPTGNVDFPTIADGSATQAELVTFVNRLDELIASEIPTIFLHFWSCTVGTGIPAGNIEGAATAPQTHTIQNPMVESTIPDPEGTGTIPNPAFLVSVQTQNVGRTSMNCPIGFRRQQGLQIGLRYEFTHSFLRSTGTIASVSRVEFRVGIQNTAGNRDNFLTHLAFGTANQGTLTVDFSTDGTNWTTSFDLLAYLVAAWTPEGATAPVVDSVARDVIWTLPAALTNVYFRINITMPYGTGTSGANAHISFDFMNFFA